MEQSRQKVGVVLMNTGSCASPEPKDVRAYLGEFLKDKRLINLPSILWYPVLHGIVLNTRPRKSAKKYQRIWTEQGSPLMVASYAQRDKLQELFDKHNIAVHVELGMRYGHPSVDEAFGILEGKGCTRVLCLPLFPQTSFVTTGSCRDGIEQAKANHPWLEVETIEGYGRDPRWMKAVADSVRERWEWQPGSKLLITYHSIPVYNVINGDTYPDEVEMESAAIAERLGIPRDGWGLSYQSRFDNRKWLQPAPKPLLSQWAKEGVRRVAVVTPGFAADCLETLWDCNIEMREHFEQCVAALDGNTASVDFTYLPALNDQTRHINLLGNLIVERL